MTPKIYLLVRRDFLLLATTVILIGLMGCRPRLQIKGADGVWNSKEKEVSVSVQNVGPASAVDVIVRFECDANGKPIVKEEWIQTYYHSLDPGGRTSASADFQKLANAENNWLADVKSCRYTLLSKHTFTQRQYKHATGLIELRTEETSTPETPAQPPSPAVTEADLAKAGEIFASAAKAYETAVKAYTQAKAVYISSVAEYYNGLRSAIETVQSNVSVAIAYMGSDPGWASSKIAETGATYHKTMAKLKIHREEASEAFKDATTIYHAAVAEYTVANNAYNDIFSKFRSSHPEIELEPIGDHIKPFIPSPNN